MWMQVLGVFMCVCVAALFLASNRIECVAENADFSPPRYHPYDEVTETYVH